MGRTAGTTSTPALRALRDAGVHHTVHTYDVSHDRHHGEMAVAALGVDPDRIFKTLVTTSEVGLAVAVVPVAAQLDLKALAAVLGVRRSALADGRIAERASGSVLGAISPLGLRTALPTVVDSSALAFAAVLVSGGRRGLQVELAPDDLVRAAGAQVAAIARRTAR